MNRKNLILPLVLAVVTLVALLALPAAAAEKAPEAKVSNVQTLTVTITAIDPAKRLITFKGPGGQTETVEATEAVKRFNELKVGDQVTIKYTEKLVARIAKPGEMSSASVGGGRSEGAKPGGALKGEATIVVTLMNVDPSVPSVTFKTAEGDVKTIHVKDKKNMEGFKAGDKVAITYSESLAVDVTTPAKK
ncbi:MAG TPA: hypothetical protein PLB02_06770 [Thermoanaerobaculia bacterium]|nr:hypothetical protein [Thermoanaerobaculia bacterium]HQR67079.1 hypothetical protein [Thermoanaerobaculia bacterium]